MPPMNDPASNPPRLTHGSDVVITGAVVTVGNDVMTGGDVMLDDVTLDDVTRDVTWAADVVGVDGAAVTEVWLTVTVTHTHTHGN